MTSGVPSLRVTWNTPQSDQTISLYWVQYRKQGTTSWRSAPSLSVSPPATSTDLTVLDAGTEYTVRVRAVSDVGTGEWSEEQTEKTFECEFCIALLAAIRCTCTCGTFFIFMVWQLRSLSALV